MKDREIEREESKVGRRARVGKAEYSSCSVAPAVCLGPSCVCVCVSSNIRLSSICKFTPSDYRERLLMVCKSVVVVVVVMVT